MMVNLVIQVNISLNNTNDSTLRGFNCWWIWWYRYILLLYKNNKNMVQGIQLMVNYDNHMVVLMFQVWYYYSIIIIIIIKNDIKCGGSGDPGIVFLLYNSNNNV